MQCIVHKYFPTTPVSYQFTNRTPEKRLTRSAFSWLQTQVANLANLRLKDDEANWLREHCPYLNEAYLAWLGELKLRPHEQVRLGFEPVRDEAGGRSEGEAAGSGGGGNNEEKEEVGDLTIHISGLWVETILYEIPLLALTSEAYFKFVDIDWSHDGQEEAAYQKGLQLFKAGCLVSEFGSRRRRDWKTHDLVLKGLKRASDELNKNNSGGGSGGETAVVGKLTSTSNVFLAKRHGIPSSGTVAHEWYMGIASIHDDYTRANELGLKYWVEHFGEGVLGIALTDTFGTPAFFKAFAKPVPTSGSNEEQKEGRGDNGGTTTRTYAQVFQGIRQDSGDPKDYIKLASDFYRSQNIPAKGKTIVFSDSLNVEKCIEYKHLAEQHAFTPTFGVGTFFTNDYHCLSNPEEKSKPLNIVIKLSMAGGRPSVKISDNVGKNTGDRETVERVKDELGYTENGDKGIDESRRW